MKKQYLKALNKLNFKSGLLREFIIRKLYSSAIIQIDFDLKKLEEDKQELLQLKEDLQGEI